MTVHVLHAGHGYTYLTRQVASHDVARQRGESLTDYYVHDGNPPGIWVGEGVSALGMTGTVTEEQMKALFGEGRHPEADTLERAVIAAGGTVQEALDATKLGRRFPKFKQPQDDGFNAFLEQQHTHFFDERGRHAAPGAERDRLRRTAAGQTLAAAGKASAPADIARYLANGRGEARQAVAGYDLVFTPVKSVSVLWGLGDAHVQREVSAAHTAAWQGAMTWLETEAALTRVGSGGVAQVDTKGLVATAFDHIDSRSGDPNLHTHLAVANKVQGLDGKWRSLDGRVLHALGVAASERYNTMIEVELTRRLGVEFVEERTSSRKRPVREITGITVELREEFSTRRASITSEFETLTRAYRAEHGHDPSKAAQYKMAQQATLSTRRAKEEGVPLSTRRAQWQGRAERLLGSREAVEAVLAEATSRRLHDRVRAVPAPFEDLHEQVMEGLVQDRAVWTIGHIQAQAQRVARTQVGLVQPDRIEPLAEQLVTAALRASLPLTPPELNPVPDSLRRADRQSVYRQHATERFTMISILDAEDRIVTAARTPGGFVVSADLVAQTTLQAAQRGGRVLNDAQVELARRFACGGHLVEAGIGPAGAGKTSAMLAFSTAVDAGGGRVLGLAPSAAAAAVLSEELGVRADTIHKLLDAHTRNGQDGTEVPEALVLDERTIILIDEAGMASTPDLDALVRLAAQSGASVRLLGDPAQLQAVGAGGVLRLVDEHVGAVHLEQVHRFTVDGEADASLAMRDGDVGALDFYVENHRTFGGTREAMIEEVYASWIADHQAGKTTLMIAASSDDVLALSTQARLDRVIAGDVEEYGANLHDGTVAGVGDFVVTRRNDRRLRTDRGTDFVKNGDVWTVVERVDDGSLRLRHRDHRSFVTIPGDYVGEDVELAYATTIHRAQGMTVDTAHLLLGAGSTREQLYTGLTRGRHTNRAYVAVDELLDPDLHVQPTGAQAVRACLETVMGRTDTTPSATATINAEHERAASLSTLVPQYEDVWERIASAGADERLADVLRAAVPHIAGEVLADESWPALRARMLRHERAGNDLPSLLSAASHRRELTSAQSTAQVLHWRLKEPNGDPTGRLPAWISPAPDLSLLLPGSTTRAGNEDLGVELDPVVEVPVAPRSAPLDADVSRVMEVNEAAWRHWRASAHDESSWVRGYLQARRLGDIDAGHAPAGWTSTIDALRAQGFTDDDLTGAGIATLSRRGHLIDRFRDRLVVPIFDTHDRIRAFTARANPTETHEGTPKYINSPTTPAYNKSEQLLGLNEKAFERLQAGATPVLVEGAMDLAAVLAADPNLVPLATCGTAVTPEQLDVLREAIPGGLGRLVVALDGDDAGLKAATRLWKMLHAHEAAQMKAVTLPDGIDPAELVKNGRALELRDRLAAPTTLTEVFVDDTLAGYTLDWAEHRVAAVRDIAEAVAALPPVTIATIAAHVQARMGKAAPQMLIDIFMTAHLDAIGTHSPRPQTPAPIAPPPVRTALDPATTRASDVDEEVLEWLDGHGDLIAARLDALVAQVEYAPPAWAREKIRAVPPSADDAARWRQDVRVIVAYRDQWDITSSEPIPVTSGRGTQEQARNAAAQALVRVAAVNATSRQRAAGIELARLRIQSERRVATARERATTQATQASTLAERAAALRQQRENAPEADPMNGTLAQRLRALREQSEATGTPHDDAPRRQNGPQR